jgi:hypothetical protein
LILIEPWMDVSKKIDDLIALEWWIDTIIGVDTGWDALYGTGEGIDNAKSTPDQDLIVLEAMGQLTNVANILSCEIAVWVDSPQDAGIILHKWQALWYTPTPEDIKEIRAYYQSLWMDGTSDIYYGKTPLAWQSALTNNKWLVEVPLPSNIVVDDKNPWNPFIHIQPITPMIFFMETRKHLEAIQRKNPTL